LSHSARRPGARDPTSATSTPVSDVGTESPMSRLHRTTFLLLAALAGGAATANGQSQPTRIASVAANAAERIYEIRTYTTHPGRLQALNARFRTHTMRLFETHGMTNVGYWIPQDSARKDNTLIYIVSHASRAQADRNWAAFRDDPEWQRVAAESERDGAIVDRIERIFMTATDYSPVK